ncbi:MAG: asparaginase, partial [Gammaproteobacteria bacterium]|nr:asparaginase [Gammaproteobacteria bacterium]
MDHWIVEISRGERVESSSLGHGIVMNADGETLLSFGNLQRETFPRSAAKWIQALEL